MGGWQRREKRGKIGRAPSCDENKKLGIQTKKEIAAFFLYQNADKKREEKRK